MIQLSNLLLNKVDIDLIDYELYELTGKDVSTFLEGQTTNSIKKLKENSFEINARTNRTGNLEFYFYVGYAKSFYYLLVKIEDGEALIKSFNDYIIMDDINFRKINRVPRICLGNYFIDNDEIDQDSLKGLFLGLPAILMQKKTKSSFDNYNLSELEVINGLVFRPKGKDLGLINNTVLNELAVGLQKGCYLGQETIAKINTRRGASRYKALLHIGSDEIAFNESEIIGGDFSINGKKSGSIIDIVNTNEHGKLLLVDIGRENYLVEKKITILLNDHLELNVKILKCPLFPFFSQKDLSQYYYNEGLNFYNHKNELDKAIGCLRMAINLQSDVADYFETLGVFLSKQGKFKDAIILMDKVLSLNEKSVMAHTNKSVFYMQMGEIEKAEREKELALTKSFQIDNNQVHLDLNVIEQKKQEQNRRRKMFEDVLSLDSNDPLANYGLSEIFFENGDYENARIYLEKVLDVDSKYSVAYLLLGKTHEEARNLELAKTVYKKGIDIAVQRGDMMPANEMQRRLNKL